MVSHLLWMIKRYPLHYFKTSPEVIRPAAMLCSGFHFRSEIPQNCFTPAIERLLRYLHLTNGIDARHALAAQHLNLP